LPRQSMTHSRSGAVLFFTTLNVWSGPVELRGALRFWNLASRTLARTVQIPGDAGGTMDVKLIPGDPHGRAITASMFSGLV